MSAVRNTLSIDVEDWYHLNYDSMAQHQGGSREARVEANTYRLLELMAEHGARATFFYLGSVAEEYPRLVRDTLAAGHEIASHGYAHELVYGQDRAAFRDDVGRSLAILQDAAGVAIRGYRAPSWSVRADTPWFYEVLGELGFDYSSSVFPFKTYLYGDGEAPLRWFTTQAGDRQLVECPATVMEFLGRRWPFSGGFYFRVLPYPVIRWAERRVNRAGRGVIYYLHPREIDPGQPRLQLPFVDRNVTYHGLKRCERKLRRLLRAGPVGTVEGYLVEQGALAPRAGGRAQAGGAGPRARTAT